MWGAETGMEANKNKTKQNKKTLKIKVQKQALTQGNKEESDFK